MWFGLRWIRAGGVDSLGKGLSLLKDELKKLLTKNFLNAGILPSTGSKGIVKGYSGILLVFSTTEAI